MIKSRANRVFNSLESWEAIVLNGFLLGLVVLSSLIFIIQTYSLPPVYQSWLKGADTFILIVFSLEYAIRFWLAEPKSKFIFNIYALIDLISIIPLLLAGFSFEFLSLLKWLRILKLLRFIEIEFHQNLWFSKNKDRLVIIKIFFNLMTLIFIYSGLIYQIEHPLNGKSFANFLDAFYFSVVTMTTVGFGDLTPLSEWGKVVTLLMILSGVAIIPSQLGELIRQFTQSQVKISLCSGCGLASHDQDALFCKHCGTKL